MGEWWGAGLVFEGWCSRVLPLSILFLDFLRVVCPTGQFDLILRKLIIPRTFPPKNNNYYTCLNRIY